MVAKDHCVLHRRAVRGDVVTFTHDFRSRRAAQRDALANDAPAHHAEGAAHNSDAATHDTTRGAPSNPIVFRIREDLSWEDVVTNSSLPVRHFLNGTSSYLFFIAWFFSLCLPLLEDYQRIYNYTPKKKGYWLYDKGKNMRGFLESIAKLNGFDPLISDTWYNVPRQEFTKHRVHRRKREREMPKLTYINRKLGP